MKTQIIFSFFFLVAFNVMAQAPKSSFGTPEDRAKLQTEKMKTALPLRPDQVDKIYTLNLKYAEIVQKEVLDTGLSQWSMYSKGSEINKRKEKELKKLITEAQYKNYEKLKAEMRRQMLSGERPKSLEDFK